MYMECFNKLSLNPKIYKMRKNLLKTCFLLALALTLNSCSREDELNKLPEKTENTQLFSKNVVISKLNSLDEDAIRKNVPEQYVELTERKLNSLKKELLNSSKENYTEKELSLLIDEVSGINSDDLNLIHKNHPGISSKSEELINRYADQGWNLSKSGNTYIYEKFIEEGFLTVKINNDEQERDKLEYFSPTRLVKVQLEVLHMTNTPVTFNFYPLNSSGNILTATFPSGVVLSYKTVMQVKSNEYKGSVRITDNTGFPVNVVYNTDGTLRNGLNFWDHGMVCVVVQN